MDWRPFKLVNGSEQKWLAQRAAPVASDWLAHWLPGETAGGTRVHAASERAATSLATEPARWISCSLREGASVTVGLRRELLHELAVKMFGADATGKPGGDTPGIVGDVLAQACGDLGQRLLALVFADPASPSAQPPAAEVWRRGSGAVIVEVTVAGQQIAALLNGPCVRQLLSARKSLPRTGKEALTDPRQCIDARTAQLEVWVGDAAIALGELQTLAVGDVISLDARFDQPLRLTIEGRESGRRVFLGCVQGARAVQLTSVQR